MKKLFLNRYFIILAVLLICFLPVAITQEAESESDAIVTAIGIDYFPQEDNIELSLQVVVPTPSAQYSQQLSVVSTKEKTVSRGVSFLSLRLGKNISFPHCKAIVFNDDATKQGVEKHLDYIIRNKANSNSIVLINTKDSAKEMLNSISDIDNSLYFSLNNSGGFNKEYIRGRQLSLGDFYKTYQSNNSSCIMGDVSLEKASEVGMVSIPSMSGGGDSSGGASQSGKEQKTVVNNGESSLIKNGKKVKSLSAEETMGFNWFDPATTKGFLLVEGVEDSLYKDAKVGVELEVKKTKIDTYFEENTPVYKLILTLYVRIAEIVEEKKVDRIYDENHSYLTRALKDKIKEKIEANILQTIATAKEYNADIMQAGKTLNKYHHTKYQKYLKQNKENPLQNIKFEYDIKLKERI